MNNNLLNPVVAEYSNSDFDLFSFIPSIKYRHKIADICANLPKVDGMKYFYLVISSNFTKSLCLGNTPDWSITYHKYKLDRLDVGINPTHDQRYVLTQSMQKDILVDLFYKWFEAYEVYETYSIIRQSEDVKIIAIAHNDHLIMNPASYYEKTVSEFENFTVEFINNMLNVIYELSPLLAFTKFFKDKDYRQDIIKGKAIFSNPLLSPREKEVLIYAFHGYTPKEMTKMLPLDNRTIEKYVANAKKKLGARNIAHAIKRALDVGLINQSL